MGSVCSVTSDRLTGYRFNDREHPYFDPKTNKEEPTWYMVSVKFLSRLPHPPSLALIKFLASSSTLPDEVKYVGEGGYKAVKEMQLVNRGRLSESRLLLPRVRAKELMTGVQPVTEEAYEAVVQLGTQGGWEGLVVKPGKAKAKAAEVKDKQKEEKVEKGSDKKGPAKKTTVKKEAAEDEELEEKKNTPKNKKRVSTKAEPIKEEPIEGTRRSKRIKVER
jgi:predicted RNA-binding protein with PUA-like domain